MLSQWIEKNFSSKRFMTQNSRYETLKSPLLKNVPPASVWMPQCIERMFLSVHPDRIIEYK